MIKAQRHRVSGWIFLLTCVLALGFSRSTSTQTGLCSGIFANPVACENAKLGNLQSEWDVAGNGDPDIQGFPANFSVNKGETVDFRVKTNSGSYVLNIYRLGYYGGLGARKVATVTPSVLLPQTQPNCLSDITTGLVDCGNWLPSAYWTVPADAVSGVYIAKLKRNDTTGASHVIFVVRDDASYSSMLFQTSDTTWQAYNKYGGNSLYSGNPVGRAYKVSYNRPLTTRIDSAASHVFNAEYPMIRFLEANGYDVSYSAGVDTDRRGAELLKHKVFLSVGHDEYWSGQQRANVEAARNAGVHLGFFSGNEIFWKTRWENSIAPGNAPYKTLVSYKDTHANARIDPTGTWTGTWRDARFSPPGDGGRPENALTGQLFMVNGWRSDTITVPAAYSKLRFWRNTAVALLAPGQTATLSPRALGYEWDETPNNGFAPPGLIKMSSTSVDVSPLYLLDNGSTYGNGTANHSLTLYRHSSGALVFGAGTVQWPWGLDITHDNGLVPTDPSMQQATVNLFADMGVQATTLRPGLLPAFKSDDTAAPFSTMTWPPNGSTWEVGDTIAITGTAADATGLLVGVEVSTDGGQTWNRATGQGNWSYAWQTPASGPVSILSRAFDDSGNMEAGHGVGITVKKTWVSLWNAGATPVEPSHLDAPVEVGVKFTSDVSGFIRGIRYYKGGLSTGVHTVSLWTSSGSLLARAQATSETPSGWQEVNFASGVAIAANTTYVASYYAPAGYSLSRPYFTTAFNSPPLHALADGAQGGNGVYSYAASPVFPVSSFMATNYWVDVAFATSGSNAPPDGTITAPIGNVTIAPGGSVTFSGTGSDPDNNLPLTYAWNFGAGGPPASTSQNPGAVVFPTAGVYTVTFTVRDSVGLVDPTPATRTVTVGGGSGAGLLPQANWTLQYADSAGPGYPGTYAFDGNANTAWTTSWLPINVPLPHEIQINLGAVYTVSGFRHLPRQDGSSAGRIGQYEFYVSVDGVDWGTAVSTGTLQNLSTEQEVQFAGKAGRYIRLRALTSLTGSPFTTLAELNVLGAIPGAQPPDGTITAPTGNVSIAPGGSVTFSGTGSDPDNNLPLTYAWNFGAGGPAASTSQNPGAIVFPTAGVYTVTFTVKDSVGLVDPTPAIRTVTVGGGPGAGQIPQGAWTLQYADSAGPGYPGTFAFDGKGSTAWTTSWIPTNAPLPHEIQINLGGLYDISGFRQLPRQDGASIGRIGQYEFYVSLDGSNWGTAVATGTFADTANQQEVPFATKTGRYVRLRALSSLAGAPFTTLAELNVLGAANCNCGGTTYSLWTASTVPASPSGYDAQAVEVGVKFKSDISGYIQGIRFYKGALNTGTHTVSLWTSTGTLLARAVATNETATGWQQVNFGTAVPITANTTYVVSYHTTSGYYSLSRPYFTAGIDNPPLHAPADGAVAGNGVYAYGPSPVFPSGTFMSTNYWVDVILSPTP